MNVNFFQKKKTWKYAATGTEGNAILFGVNIFDYKWSNINESIKIHDPLYKQEHIFKIYQVIINNQEYKFAAGEFSNGVWGFYIS